MGSGRDVDLSESVGWREDEDYGRNQGYDSSWGYGLYVYSQDLQANGDAVEN